MAGALQRRHKSCGDRAVVLGHEYVHGFIVRKTGAVLAQPVRRM
jgi:hypothetical protein